MRQRKKSKEQELFSTVFFYKNKRFKANEFYKKGKYNSNLNLRGMFLVETKS
jgi:hypothetical protein